MQTPPRSQFVTVMAWLSLGLAAFGVISGVMQWLVFAGSRPDRMLLDVFAGSGLALPPALLWTFDHMGLLMALSLLSSLLFGLSSWGLLQRREWGRLSFIALLVLGALAALAGAYAFGAMLDWANAQAGGDIATLDPMLAQLQASMKLIMYLGMLAIAALHGAIVWKLCTPAIRAEFR